MRTSQTFIIVLLLSLLLAGCGGPKYEAPPADAELNVAVSILPQRYFVKKIGGDHVSVLVMAGPGELPLTYEPPKREFKAMKDRDAYFLMGIPPEDTWLPNITKANPAIKIVDTTLGIERPHNDPHIWLSPRLVKIQAQTIADALIEMDPKHEADYRANLDAFSADLDALDADLQTTLQPVAGKTFIVSHPAWGYFARDYGLKMEAMGDSPNCKSLNELAQLAEKENIDIIFYQRGFDEEQPQLLASLIEGARVMPLSPLNPNWENNLRSVSLMLAESMR